MAMPVAIGVGSDGYREILGVPAIKVRSLTDTTPPRCPYVAESLAVLRNCPAGATLPGAPRQITHPYGKDTNTLFDAG